MKEYAITIHVTTADPANLQAWLDRANEILGENYIRLTGHLCGDDDEGAWCSGHVAASPELLPTQLDTVDPPNPLSQE